MLAIALVAKTREDVTIAINNEWSKKITGEIKKSEEKVQSMEDQLNRKKKEIETLRVGSDLLVLNIESSDTLTKPTPGRITENQRI